MGKQILGWKTFTYLHFYPKPHIQFKRVNALKFYKRVFKEIWIKDLQEGNVHPPDVHASATGMTVIPTHTKIPHTLQNDLFQLSSVASLAPLWSITNGIWLLCMIFLLLPSGDISSKIILNLYSTQTSLGFKLSYQRISEFLLILEKSTGREDKKMDSLWDQSWH